MIHDTTIYCSSVRNYPLVISFRVLPTILSYHIWQLEKLAWSYYSVWWPYSHNQNSHLSYCNQSGKTHYLIQPIRSVTWPHETDQKRTNVPHDQLKESVLFKRPNRTNQERAALSHDLFDQSEEDKILSTEDLPNQSKQRTAVALYTVRYLL